MDKLVSCGRPFVQQTVPAKLEADDEVFALSQLLQSYCVGTAGWYTLRGLCRIYDPAMVVGCEQVHGGFCSMLNIRCHCLVYRVQTSQPASFHCQWYVMRVQKEKHL